MCVSSCQMSDLLDDGMGSFCQKVHFGLDLSIFVVSECVSRHQAHRSLRHADISILHGRLQLPAVRKSSVKGVQAHAILLAIHSSFGLMI